MQKRIFICSGNTQGAAALAEGMDTDRVIELFADIDFSGRGALYPAQLTQTLKNEKKTV